MLNTTYLKNALRVVLTPALLFLSLVAKGQAFTEDFDNVANLTANGWFFQNNSQPIGSTAYYQGSTLVFNSYNGAANSYMAANYNNGSGTATISDWAVMPNVIIRNGDIFTFRTRKAAPDQYPDRLQLRMSTNGASTNVGTLATDVGDFTTLLLEINPTLITGVYPVTWTLYTVTISGLSAPTSGRFAFRYFVTNGGPNGSNSDYIGIDNAVYTPYVCPVLTVSGGPFPNGTGGVSYPAQSFSQTGSLGTPSYAVTAGALPAGMTVSASGQLGGTPMATGTFNFTVTVTDASGCSASNNFTITIDCPVGGASLTLAPVCSNAGIVTLTGGLPAGGNYSGTGVTNNTFDPSVGSQQITYEVTDGYGCHQSATAMQAVNTPPSVTLAPFTPYCGTTQVQLTGGLPSGGTWSGTGVTGNMFDPSAGTQTITYSYTDANGCTGSASRVFTIIPPPTVLLAELPELCTNSAPLTLYGGVPDGGVFSGQGVVNGVFTQTAPGTYLITYTYSTGGCTASITLPLYVHIAPASAALAGAANTIETQFITDVPASTEVRYTADCDLMAIVNPSAPYPIGGNMNVSVLLDDSVNTYQNKPYVQRHYSIITMSNSVAATGTITLYAYQSEFNAYNAVAATKGLPMLPTGVDNGNVRITSFRGPQTVPDQAVPTETVIPAVSWDATHGWWVMTFPVTQIGGFYIHTGDITVDVPEVGSSANGTMQVFPNPATDKINVEISGTRGKNAKLCVTDITGRVLVQAPMDNDKALVDMSSLAAGMYIVTYSDDDRKDAVKITKK